MGALKVSVAAGVLLGAAPAHGSNIELWQPYIAEAAARFAIPGDWIARVMLAESGGRTTLDGRSITSPKGAMGLMQLMPGTWAEMRQRLNLGANPHDPRDNILAGAGYLRMMHDRFGYPGLFAAYHVGPQRYAEHLAAARNLPPETVTYLARLVTDKASATSSKQPTDPIFFTLRSAVSASKAGPNRHSAQAIFVIGGGTPTARD